MLLVILLSFAAQAQDNPWDYSYSDEAAAGLFGLGLVCCIVPVIWFIICIMLAIWLFLISFLSRGNPQNVYYNTGKSLHQME